jgi:hypothetical protein
MKRSTTGDSVQEDNVLFLNLFCKESVGGRKNMKHRDQMPMTQKIEPISFQNAESVL